MVCSTLGFLECIRVPLPAARIRAQQEEENALESDIISPHAYLSLRDAPGAASSQMFPPRGRRASIRRHGLTVRYNSYALQAPAPCVRASGLWNILEELGKETFSRKAFPSRKPVKRAPPFPKPSAFTAPCPQRSPQSGPVWKGAPFKGPFSNTSQGSTTPFQDSI